MKTTEYEKLVAAVKKCFPCVAATDGTLLVHVDNYNELVEIINNIELDEIIK